MCICSFNFSCNTKRWELSLPCPGGESEARGSQRPGEKQAAGAPKGWWLGAPRALTEAGVWKMGSSRPQAPSWRQLGLRGRLKWRLGAQSQATPAPAPAPAACRPEGGAGVAQLGPCGTVRTSRPSAAGRSPELFSGPSGITETASHGRDFPPEASLT